MELITTDKTTSPPGSLISVRALGRERVIEIARRAIREDTTPSRTTPLAVHTNPVVTLFLNRSLRTRLGVARACARLGVAIAPLDPGEIYTPAVEGPAAAYSEERIEDILRVVERHASCFAVRAYGPSRHLPVGGGDQLVRFLAANSCVPIINLESDSSHPIQALADLATLLAETSPARRRVVIAWAFSPEPKPVAVPSSALLAFAAAGAELTVAAPSEFALPAPLIDTARDWASASGGKVDETTDLNAACDGAHVVYMKSWLGPDASADDHRAIASAYEEWRATETLIGRGDAASYMHCLPADRDLEVDSTVLDGRTSLVWRQVEMRRIITEMVIAAAVYG